MSKAAKPSLSRLPNANRKTGGNVAVTFSLMAATVTALAGGAVDFALGRTHEAALQHAADASALETAIAFGGSQEIDIDHVNRFFMNNFAANDGSGTPVVTAIEHDGLYTVSATMRAPTLFLGLVGIQGLELEATATAEPIMGAPLCILLLEPREIGLELNSHANLEADCGIHVNSRNREAIHANSRSVVDSAANFVVGGSFTNSRSTISPAPVQGAPVLADPMEGFPAPSLANRSGCDHEDLVIDEQNARITPGIYCGLIFNSGANVTMAPGTYVIRNGQFLINSLSTAQAEGVTLYFEGENAGLMVNSGSSLTLTAPRTGAYRGVAIFQSPEVVDAEIYLNSGSDGMIEGLVYAPNNRIVLNSQVTTNSTSSDHMVIIARDMYLNSHSNLRIRMADSNVDLPREIETFARSGTMSVRLVH